MESHDSEQLAPTAREQLVERVEHVRRLCDAYKDQPPPLFRGPGLSEHGKGYNHGTRDIARAVLSYLDGDQGDDDGPSELIAAAAAERERRRAVAINAAGAVLATAGRFVALSERRQLVDAVLTAYSGHTWAVPQSLVVPEHLDAEVAQTFDIIDDPLHDALAADGYAPPVPGQLTVSPMLPADGWDDVDQASIVCGQVERIGSRFADDGPGQVLVLVRLPDGTPVMGAAALHLFVAGTRSLRPASER